MALDLLSCENSEDEYIDIEVNSNSTFHFNSIIFPTHSKEFEFQMSSFPQGKEPNTSPADNLFYKGKLLPLHLLVQNSNSVFDTQKDTFKEFYTTPLATNLLTPTPTPTPTSTPFESCNITPSEPRSRVSRELNPEEYLCMYEYFSTKQSCFINENPKKSLTFKKHKQPSFGLKLKSWFGKYSCSHESNTVATKVSDEGSGLKSKEHLSKNVKEGKKNSFGQFQKDKYKTSSSNFVRDKITEDDCGQYRRSFSMAFINHSKAKKSSVSAGTSSTSSTNSLNDNHEVDLVKRCSSIKFEIESSIQGAIAHCKQSQQLFRSRETTS